MSGSETYSPNPFVSVTLSITFRRRITIIRIGSAFPLCGVGGVRARASDNERSPVLIDGFDFRRIFVGGALSFRSQPARLSLNI